MVYTCCYENPKLNELVPRSKILINRFEQKVLQPEKYKIEVEYEFKIMYNKELRTCKVKILEQEVERINRSMEIASEEEGWIYLTCNKITVNVYEIEEECNSKFYEVEEK